jgi:S-adenosylmethionine:tRNA ribosyltransferase-isomerase
VSAGAGSTSLVITPERGLRTIDGLLTGWHEPGSSHLELIEAAAGAELLGGRTANRFQEFGDAHLVPP